MLRAFKPTVPWFALLALAALSLRPCWAQQAGDPYGGVRTQGIDPQQNLPGSSTSAIPSDMQFQGPNQPMPVSRPVNWPGTPVDAGNMPAGSTAPASLPPMATPSAGSRSGVRVWDPLPSQAAPPNQATPPSQSIPPSGVTPVSYPSAAAPAIQSSPAYQSLSANQSPPAAAQAYPSTGYPAPAFSAAAATPAPGTSAAAAAALPPSYPQMASRNPSPYPNTTLSGTPAPNANLNAALAPQAAPPAGAAPVASDPSPDALTGSTNLQILPAPPKEYPDAQMAARIGTEVVLVSDLKAMAGDMLVQKKMTIPKEQEAEFYDQADRQVLKQLIETKLVFNDAMHNIPPTALTTMETKVNEFFDKDQLPELMKTYNAATRQELDVKLREHGSSLDRTRKQFYERTVAKEWLRQQVKQLDEDVPHADVLGYYKQHLADYEFPAKVRWEELMVRFDQYPNKEAAFAALAEMGNLSMRGSPFADVAKARSQGATAADGGVHDWTIKGSLVSKTLDDSLFTLPVGTFSQIVESERGFHIIRVMERKDAGRTSFVDAQVEIKKKLKEDNVKKQINQYLDDLRKKTPVTTMYDAEQGSFDQANKTAQSKN